MKTAQYNKKKIMAKKSTTREIAFGFANGQSTVSDKNTEGTYQMVSWPRN